MAFPVFNEEQHLPVPVLRGLGDALCHIRFILLLFEILHERLLCGVVQDLLVRLDRLIFGAILERSEEHTSELQSLMRNSYAVFCLKQQNDSWLQQGQNADTCPPGTPP